MQARSVAAMGYNFRSLRTFWRTISRLPVLNEACSQSKNNQPEQAVTKRPQIKSDIKCKTFYMLIPHLCVENKTEGEYFVKCTSPKPSNENNEKDINQLTVEEGAIQLFEDGYVPLKRNAEVKFEFPFSAIFNKIDVSIYEVSESGIKEYCKQLIGANKRVTIM